jgi:hypothetical protein
MGTPEIRSVDQQKKGINLLIYGDNGVGKTPLIATSPKCLILSADPNGTASAYGSGCDVVDITDWDVMEDVHEDARNGAIGKRYEWIWLDSVSGFQDVGLEHIMRELVAIKEHRKIHLPDKGEFGANMNRIKLWTRWMADLPINFGMTAYPVQTEDEEGNAVFMPYIQGKGMPQTISGYMSVIGFMEVVDVKGEPKKVLNFQKRDLYYARDRYGALPARMGDPTIPKIQKMIDTKLAAVRQAAPKKAVAARPPAKKAPVQRPAPRR